MRSLFFISTLAVLTAALGSAPGEAPKPHKGKDIDLYLPTQIDCVTHRAGTTGTATYDGDAEINGDVGIRTNGADASFDYVFVVASPATP